VGYPNNPEKGVGGLAEKILPQKNSNSRNKKNEGIKTGIRGWPETKEKKKMGTPETGMEDWKKP